MHSSVCLVSLWSVDLLKLSDIPVWQSWVIRLDGFIQESNSTITGRHDLIILVHCFLKILYVFDVLLCKHRLLTLEIETRIKDRFVGCLVYFAVWMVGTVEVIVWCLVEVWCYDLVWARNERSWRVLHATCTCFILGLILVRLSKFSQICLTSETVFQVLVSTITVGLSFLLVRKHALLNI